MTGVSKKDSDYVVVKRAEFQLKNALQLIDAASAETSNARALYVTWFGSYTRSKLVKRNFELAFVRALKFALPRDAKNSETCVRGAYGYFSYEDNEIHFCPKWDNEPIDPTEQRLGKVVSYIHELMHAVTSHESNPIIDVIINPKTNALAYSYFDCKKLAAKGNGSSARMNASNYHHFIKQIYVKKPSPSKKKSKPKKIIHDEL